MAKIKLPEQLKSWKVISPVSETSGYPTFKVLKTEFDGSKVPAILTYVNYEGENYSSDNVDLINEEAAFVKNVLKLRGVSNYIDAVVENNPAKSSISLYLLTTDAEPITESFLKNKQLTDAEIVDFGLQISEILEKLEQNNILHGNLKPENIFINKKGKFVLGGFTAFEGTAEDPSFLAPEMEAGKQPDYTTDIYSLGLIMYTMVNGGKLPFETTDRVSSVSKRFSSTTVPAPSGGSEKLKSVIVIACQPKNKNRWKNAGNIKNALAAIKAELPIREESADQVIAPENTEFESNMFEEFTFDGNEPAPAPKQDTEPEQPAPVMAKGAAIAASAAIISALNKEDGEVAEKPEKAETTENAEADKPEAAESAADSKTDGTETGEAKAEAAEGGTADAAKPDDNNADVSYIDNGIFDDYVVQGRNLGARKNDNEKKDYGDFFEDDEPSMEYIDPESQQTDISYAATIPAKKASGNNNYSQSPDPYKDDREPTKRNKTFIVGIVVIVLAVLVALAGLGVLAAQNGWLPFGGEENPTDAVQADTQETTVAPTQPDSTAAAASTAATEATKETETQSDEEVVPENVVGYFYDYAVEVLEGQGFKVNYDEREYSDEWDEDFIISMSPDSSAPVKKGTTIKIVRSRGSKSSSGSYDESSSSESSSSENSSSESSSSESSSSYDEDYYSEE